MAPDGSDVRRLTNSPGDDRVPDWSADGRRIAFASDRMGAGHPEIFVMNADGSGVAQLTHESEYAFGPAWSPDGTRVAFYSIRPSTGFRTQIYVINTDGTGERNISNSTGEDFGPSWSPDGSHIAFWSRRSSDGEIWTMNADGSGQTRLTDVIADDVYPDWSPDGSRIAFTSTRPGYGDDAVWVMDPDGSDLHRIAPGGGPSWSPDGSKLVFGRGYPYTSDRFPDVFTMNADGTGIANITKSPGTDGSASWQPIANRAPDCSAVRAAPDSLWPPNHKLVRVTLSGATDADGDRVTLDITAVTGGTPRDSVLGPGSNQVRLRATRGRSYSIAFKASDGHGDQCTGNASVTVARPGT